MIWHGGAHGRRNDTAELGDAAAGVFQPQRGTEHPAEIDHDELGAQWQEVALTLRGVGVDPRSGRVEIMLDDGERAGAHLTHSIRAVTDVDVLTGADGRDWVLRIAHPGGQSLLTLV